MSEQMKKTDSPAQPSLCATGCGFFANPLNGGFCSKCYKDHLANKEKEEQHAAAVDAGAAGAEQEGREAMDTDEAPPAEVPVCRVVPGAAEGAGAPPGDEASADAAEGKEAAAAAEGEAKAIMEAIAASSEPPPPPPVCQVASGAGEDETPERRVQKNHSRCMECNKKIGLTGFKCRCGYTFCATHRYTDAHKCDFDYKAAGRAELAKANPLVVADKVTRI